MTTGGFKIAFVTFYYQPRYHKNHSGKQKKYKNGWSVNLSFKCESNESTNCCDGTSQSTTCT